MTFTVFKVTLTQNLNGIIILQALKNSVQPDMLDQILRVLYWKKMGTELHAKEMQEHYHEQINLHEQCEKCKEKT